MNSRLLFVSEDWKLILEGEKIRLEILKVQLQNPAILTPYFEFETTGAWADAFVASGYGTPRIGASTEPQSLSVNYIIKYADVIASTAVNVVPLDGSVPMTSLTVNGNVSATSVQIANGNPANGAVFLATNVFGQGKWSSPVYFRLSMDADFAFTNNDARTVIWDTEEFDYGNNASATTFICPVNGIYRFLFHGYWNRVSGANPNVNAKIRKNGVTFAMDYSDYWPDASLTAGSFLVDSGEIYMTNGAVITCAISGNSPSTNKLFIDGTINYFCGKLVREMP